MDAYGDTPDDLYTFFAGRTVTSRNIAARDAVTAVDETIDLHVGREERQKRAWLRMDGSIERVLWGICPAMTSNVGCRTTAKGRRSGLEDLQNVQSSGTTRAMMGLRKA